MMQPESIKFFKRNPKAKVVHQVMDKIFTDLAAATRYKKAWRCKTVSTWLRKEYEEVVKKSKEKVSDETLDTNTQTS